VLAQQVANTALLLRRQTAQSSKDSVLISSLAMLISVFRKILYGQRNAGKDVAHLPLSLLLSGIDKGQFRAEQPTILG
jgi:hypothetical protein